MILPALVFPVLVGFAGLAVEGGLWYADRHQLRTMADSASLAGAWARRENEDAFDAAVAAAEALGFDASTDELVLNAPPLTGTFTSDVNAVEVIVRRSRPLLISALFMESDSVGIGNRAVSRFESQSAPCMLALNDHASGAISFSGNTQVELDGCGIASNSNADNAMTFSGNSHLIAEWLETPGGVDISGNAYLTTDTEPELGTSPQGDPYADLPEPPRPADCPSGSHDVYTPCTFVGGKTFSGNSDTELEPGLYFVDGGEFRVSGNAEVAATGVTVYLTGGATLSFSGNGSLDFSAPTNGTYAGIAFMQDRDDPHGTSQLSGNALAGLEGSVYLPNQQIQYSGNGGLGSGCARMIADTLQFTGNSSVYLGSNCPGAGLPDAVANPPRLVE